MPSKFVKEYNIFTIKKSFIGTLNLRMFL